MANAWQKFSGKDKLKFNAAEVKGEMELAKDGPYKGQFVFGDGNYLSIWAWNGEHPLAAPKGLTMQNGKVKAIGGPKQSLLVDLIVDKKCTKFIAKDCEGANIQINLSVKDRTFIKKAIHSPMCIVGFKRDNI